MLDVVCPLDVCAKGTLYVRSRPIEKKILMAVNEKSFNKPCRLPPSHTYVIPYLGRDVVKNN